MTLDAGGSSKFPGNSFKKRFQSKQGVPVSPQRFNPTRMAKHAQAGEKRILIFSLRDPQEELINFNFVEE